MSRPIGLLVIAMSVLPLTGGCNPSTVVSGSVTYDGKTIENGAITFVPANGQGPAVGAPIAAGSYRIDSITPGTKLVQIVGVKSVPFARSSEEMACRAAEAAKQGDTSGIIDRADEVPATAIGNNVEVDVKPGRQTMNFRLQPPAG